MPKLDEFESVFRSASKPRYRHVRTQIHKVLVFTDMDAEATRRFVADIDDFLSELGEGVTWRGADGDSYQYADELLAIVEEFKPDLICTYRNLHGRARHFPFSLGALVDVLTQATTTPVMLLPAPTTDGRLSSKCRQTKRVMVLTHRMTGSDQLVSFGVRFTEPRGDLYLTHLEEEEVYARYMEAISKIPSIDTDAAAEAIREQLLKEPRDYIRSCIEELSHQGLTMAIHEVVEMGHHLRDCKRLVERFGVDLIIMNSKDEERLAMHGLAYPLAVELRDTPILLL